MICSQKKQKSISLGNYALKTTIGKGNSAVVKLATHAFTKQKVAIKMFDRSGLDNEKSARLKREIDSMKRLKHSNIIQLYEIMETPKLICLVTEYASNGELYDYIINNKRLSEREARYFFKQIVAAVHYCHKHNTVHRDIKVENLLLDAYLRVKLADFGFSSTYKKNELMDTWCGSPPYSAPELYLSQLYDGPKVDIWSLGVVLYILVCRRLPFDARSFHKLRSQVISGYYNTPFFLSEDCKNLIKGMLTVKPLERFNMDDIINHKWFCVDVDANDCEDLKKIVNQIENISINDTETFQPDENVLAELKQIGIDTNLVIESIKNKIFDENEAMYHLIETKIKKSGNKYSLSQETDLVLSLLPKSIKNQPIEDDSNSDRNIIDNEIMKQNQNKFSEPQKLEGIIYDQEIYNTDECVQNSDEMDDYDNEMAKQYLTKYGGLRRHTIGTNPENNHKNDIMKSIECLIDKNKRNFLKTGCDNMLTEIQEINHNQSSTLSSNYVIKEDTELNDKKFSPKQCDNFFTKELFSKTNLIKTHESHECLQNNNEAYDSKTSSDFNSFVSNQYLIPPLSYGRRASDGGSNISLFNQYFSIKNSTHDSISTQHSRGSITSGIPIETISSDDDEENLVKSKKPRTRQESDANHELLNYRSKKEQSFDATSSIRNRSLMHHRASEPNHIDILISNRTHLEHLYNQGLNRELNNLQKEASIVDFDRRKPWRSNKIQNDNEIENRAEDVDESININKQDESILNSVLSATSQVIKNNTLNTNKDEISINTNKNEEININETNKNNLDLRNGSLHHIPDRLKNFSHENTNLDESIIYQKLNSQSQNDQKYSSSCINLLSQDLNVNVQNLLNVSNLLSGKVNINPNNLSSSSLHMIQEEQSDGLSASTTPRLSQTSTTSNNSTMDTYLDDIIDEKPFHFNKHTNSHMSNSNNNNNNNNNSNCRNKTCSIDLNTVTTVLFPYRCFDQPDNSNDVQQFVNGLYNFNSHNFYMNNTCNSNVTNTNELNNNDNNNNTSNKSEVQSQYSSLVSHNYKSYQTNFMSLSSPPTTSP